MTDKTLLSKTFAEALNQHHNFSQEEKDKAIYCLQDFLACAFATGHFPWVQQAQNVARTNSATFEGGAPILGTSYRVSVQDAAFANAVAGHSLVRDDMHVGSVSHLGVVVIPAALALAEQEAVSGRQLLEAIICGYEAGGKLGAMLMDVETAKKFRPTGLIGAFAAAATSARLTGMDSEQTSNALGFAANYITGFNEWADWGSDDMYFHPGIAVRNGITATLLARAGAVAAAGTLDGKAGLFAALGKTVPASPALPFSSDTEIMQVFFKQVPACNYAQTAAQTALRLRQTHDLDPADIDTVAVSVPHAAAHYPGCNFPGPFTSILQARMSIHFNVASALLNGDFDDSHYGDFGNVNIGNLSKRIVVAEDASLTAQYPGKQSATVTVSTNKRDYTSHLDDVMPASNEEVLERFQAVSIAALGEEKAGRLAEAIRNLEKLDTLDSLLRSLQ